MHSDVSEWSGRLAALAEFVPPAAGWRGVLAARDAREARRDRRWPIALAAAVLVATAGLAGLLQSTQRALSAGNDGADVAARPVAAAMRAQNERLEVILARLPERHAMRGRTAFTVAELEDRLAILDDRLSHVALEPNPPERAEQLWRERVDVMHSLVQVRYADVVGAY
jgi:hypothetical protein